MSTVKESQLMLFKDEDRNKIAVAFTNLKENSAISGFRELSKTINECTGKLPPNAEIHQSLRRVTASYSDLNMRITKGLSETGGKLKQYIVKGIKIIERNQMTEEDKAKLLQIGSKINRDYILNIEEFVEGTRKELIAIQSSLFNDVCGGRLSDLNNKRNLLEIKLIEISNTLKNLASQTGSLKGEIESLTYLIETSNKNIDDSQALKKQRQEELNKLILKEPKYEQMVKDQRDTHTERNQGFWIFTWKVEDIRVDNGERIALEQQNFVREQIKQMTQQIENWNDNLSHEKIESAKAKLPAAKAKLNVLNKTFEQETRNRDSVEQEFNSVMKEIEDIYTGLNTRDFESIENVDKLAKAVFNGSEDIIRACGQMTTYLRDINADNADPDLLPNSIFTAIQLLYIVDQYNRTNLVTLTKALCLIE